MSNPLSILDPERLVELFLNTDLLDKSLICEGSAVPGYGDLKGGISPGQINNNKT